MSGLLDGTVQRVGALLRGAFPPRNEVGVPPLDVPTMLPRCIVLAVLVGSASLDDGIGHAHSHWFVIGGYVVATAFAGFGRKRADGMRAWVPTLLDAGLVAYVLVEHLAAPVAVDRVTSDAVSQLPAFLLLLASGLALRTGRTAVFAAVVTFSWGIAIALMLPWGSAAWGHQVFGVATFIAASAFVLHGVARLRRSVATTIRVERERSFLSRFVPPGTDLKRFAAEGWSELRRREACLLAVDIRGFSQLSKTHPGPDVLRWLLKVRSMINASVTANGGMVDKYVGDGVLAQFFEGVPRQQAMAAYEAAASIRAGLQRINDARLTDTEPELRLVIALHAGSVLAGVLDDGIRAELTVLGPAMNALSRIERRAKDEDIDVLASKRFARLLGSTSGADFKGLRLPRRHGDNDAPDVVALDAPVVASRQGTPQRHHLESLA
jgi:adenylate cyclase